MELFYFAALWLGSWVAASAIMAESWRRMFGDYDGMPAICFVLSALIGPAGLLMALVIWSLDRGRHFGPNYRGMR